MLKISNGFQMDFKWIKNGFKNDLTRTRAMLKISNGFQMDLNMNKSNVEMDFKWIKIDPEQC